MTSEPRSPDESEEGLLGLPLFANRRPSSELGEPGRLVGRVRSEFSIVPAPEPRNGIHLVHPEPPAPELPAPEPLAPQPLAPQPRRVQVPRPAAGESLVVDWALVAAFRQQASKRLMEALGGSGVRYYAEEEKREIGRGIIVEMVQAHAADAVARGERGWSAPMVAAMAKAVFDSQFRMGRLQPLLDQDSVENIMRFPRNRGGFLMPRLG